MISLQVYNRISAVLLLCVLVSLPMLAQDNFVSAKKFLKGAYPATLKEDFTTTVTDQLSFNTPYGLDSFVIQLDRPGSTSYRAVRCEDASAWALTAAFVFAGDGSIRHVVVSGPIVHEAENEKLRNLVDSNPDWTREQVMEAFKASGALYGPDMRDALMKQLPTSALRIVLGDFHVASVDFLVRDVAQMNEHLPSAELHWLVKVDATEQKLGRASYFLIFEPFEGRLSQLGRIGG